MANFVQMIEKMNGGNTLAALNTELTEVVRAVSETNKQGSLMLKLKISPNGDNGITIEEDVATKLPKPSSGKSLFFTDGEGDLLRSDPRQKEMFQGRAVDTESTLAAG